METLRLVLPAPGITWGNVAQLCGQAVNPMYRGLYSILEGDMEHVAQILAALESHPEQVSTLPLFIYPSHFFASRFNTRPPVHSAMDLMTMTRPKTPSL